MADAPPPYENKGAPYPGAQPAPYPAGQPGQAPYPAGQPGQAPYPAAPQPSYAAAPPQYGQQQYGQQTTVIAAQPTVVVQTFRDSPVTMGCPYCQAQIVTRLSYETGTLTWIACAVTAFVGCWLGCCLIPFCIDGCKDAVHFCPNCNRQVGRYTRL